MYGVFICMINVSIIKVSNIFDEFENKLLYIWIIKKIVCKMIREMYLILIRIYVVK